MSTSPVRGLGPVLLHPGGGVDPHHPGVDPAPGGEGQGAGPENRPHTQTSQHGPKTGQRREDVQKNLPWTPLPPLQTFDEKEVFSS